MSTGQKKVAGVRSVKQSRASSCLEQKLDELRKELSSDHGGIFPHSVLSTQQISMIDDQKPNSMEQVSPKFTVCQLVRLSLFLIGLSR